MSVKTKDIVRKIIYFILFGLLLFCFIWLGNKYADNSKPVSKQFNDYYADVKTSNIKVVNGSVVKNLIKHGTNIIFIGNSETEWSKVYAKFVSEIVNGYNGLDIYYYDLNNDKSLLNSNYYDIIDLLEGSLVTTDSGDNNLLAPSLYIIKDGEVQYYNIDTVTMKNGAKVEEYWSTEKILSFKEEVTNAINKYYLNIQ